jgi:formylglycine-generating enzyme
MRALRLEALCLLAIGGGFACCQQQSQFPAAPTDAGPIGEEAGTGREAGEPITCTSTFPRDGCDQPTPSEYCRDGWCSVPAGCFIMGSPECDWGRGLYNEDEHRVTMTHGFLIQQFETTQQQWGDLGLDNPSGLTPDGLGDCIAAECPVGNVSWYDALEFANRRSQRDGLAGCYKLEGCTGSIAHELKCAVAEGAVPNIYDCRGYRLPTEAEWEYAARAGTQTSFYSGWITKGGPSGDCERDEALEPIAWYCSNANRLSHPVGGKRANAWGLHDMIGNVYEWVWDGYNKRYPTVPVVDPGAVLEPEVERIKRGGSSIGSAAICKVSQRLAGTPELHRPGGGFRLVRTQ